MRASGCGRIICGQVICGWVICGRVIWGWTILIALAGASAAQDSNFATGPQYLMTSGSPLFARAISTPSISLASPPLEVGATAATDGLIPGAATHSQEPPNPDAPPSIDFFPIFYGSPTPPPQTIEISFAETSSSQVPIPPSILQDGLGPMTIVEARRAEDADLTLPQAAAYLRMQPRPSPRLYTNADILRLHQGS